MEIVLGIDNVIFISIVTNKLPQEQQKRARFLGLSLALGFRVVLLFFIATIVTWTEPLFRLSAITPSFVHEWLVREEGIDEVSVRDLILLAGGLFLIYQSVREIHHLTASQHDSPLPESGKQITFGSVLFQIALLDVVFSLDSVITAVGMVDSVPTMIAAVVVSMIVMMIFAGPIANFVMKHPTVKVLALSFLLMIGVMLVAEGFGTHFNKNYIYFAMAFALGVELLNLRVHRTKQPA